MEGPKTYTATGNVRPPSKVLCLQWVKGCWEALTAEIVQKSFHACGISVSTDGTEDDEIHCLKEGGVAADARETVKRETATLTLLPLAALPEADDLDPFADIEEDEEELEENEVVLEDC